MSWAAHNVEAYDQILKDGVVVRINRELDDAGFEEMDSDTVIAIVDSIFQAADPKVKDALINWSRVEVSDAEADHFANTINRG